MHEEIPTREVSMYRLEVFNPQLNTYIIHSWHSSRNHAEAEAEAKISAGNNVRIVHKGMTILWYRNGDWLVGRMKKG